MAAFPTVSRSGWLDREKNRSIAPRSPRFALPIRLSLCRPHSAVLTSNCDLRTIIICSQNTHTSETRSPTSSRHLLTRLVCVDFPVCPRAPSFVPMSHDQALLPLVAIVGPTAAGKSALGVWLAEQLGGEVVACDSTQLYKGFDVGTAKPSLAERRGIPHHLIDVLTAGEDATAGGYRQLAIRVLEDLRRRGRIPVFTVGTGLYLRALLEGLADVPQRSEELRERLRASSDDHAPGHLHRILRRLDVEASRKIATGDQQKLIRAIEVCLLTKRPLSEVHRSGRIPLQGWRPVKIGLMPPREALYQRIHARTDAMLSSGWTDEVGVLLSSGLAENAKPFDF